MRWYRTPIATINRPDTYNVTALTDSDHVCIEFHRIHALNAQIALSEDCCTCIPITALHATLTELHAAQ